MISLRRQVSDFVTEHVSSWKFIAGYTATLVAWIYLNKVGTVILDPDLNYCNFFLAWLAGIQASLVMQSEGRREDNLERVLALHFTDTHKHLELSAKSLDVDLKNKELIKKMITKVNSMMEIIELMEKEEEENGKRKSTKTNFRQED